MKDEFKKIREKRQEMLTAADEAQKKKISQPSPWADELKRLREKRENKSRNPSADEKAPATENVEKKETSQSL